MLYFSTDLFHAVKGEVHVYSEFPQLIKLPPY